MSYDIQKIVDEAPDNFVIRDALCKCHEVIESHKHIVCLISGGGDSDLVLDMMVRCGGAANTDFIFVDTGLEYEATHEHIAYLEAKYGVTIHRQKAVKPIPVCTREYGVPFWSKFAAEMIYRLQLHDFQFEDEPYEVLMKRYPNCQTALQWWCNISKGTTMYNISRAPYLKEFMVQSPPRFKISNKCCDYAKKKTSEQFQKRADCDCVCIGVRKAEGGIRASHKTCFSERDGAGQFRPIFWFRDSDKEEYEKHYGIVHSRCYTEYGLQRTGCFGCPFGKRFEEELIQMQDHEPKLLKAANAIFGESYEYTRQYLAFREQKKEEKRELEKQQRSNN